MNDVGRRRGVRARSLLLLVVLAGACNPRTPAVPTAAPATMTATEIAATAAPTLPFAPLTPSLRPEPALSPTATPLAVTVSAVKGNLYIRRGPDVGFNPIGVLVNGQSAAASGRDVLGKWLRIPLPGDPEADGWVSIQTIYSTVSGDVDQLPEIMPTYWPVPAFLRNCTFHNMTAEPGGIQLPSVLAFPANDVRVNPGTYRVYDTDVDGAPEVLKVELKEGSAIDIRDDGSGDHRKCPVP